MSKAEFEDNMKALYKQYLLHCAEDGILLPMPYPGFRQQVSEHIARDLSHKLAAKEKITPSDDVLYVASRVADLSNPVSDAIIRSCSQCGESVWVDPTMKARLDQSSAIVCVKCIPEITGKSFDDIVNKKMEGL